MIAKSLSNPDTACLKAFGSYVQVAYTLFYANTAHNNRYLGTMHLSGVSFAYTPVFSAEASAAFDEIPSFSKGTIHSGLAYSTADIAFQSQIECFDENDIAIQKHIQCMNEMDLAIRRIEEYKNQVEQAFRLTDLGERVRNLQV